MPVPPQAGPLSGARRATMAAATPPMPAKPAYRNALRRNSRRSVDSLASGVDMAMFRPAWADIFPRQRNTPILSPIPAPAVTKSRPISCHYPSFFCRQTALRAHPAPALLVATGKEPKGVRLQDQYPDNSRRWPLPELLRCSRCKFAPKPHPKGIPPCNDVCGRPRGYLDKICVTINAVST